MKRHDSATAWPRAEQPPGEIETATPSRAASVQSDVAVPGLQALITGLALGGVITLGYTALSGKGGDPVFTPGAGYSSDGPTVLGTVALWLVLSAIIAALAWLLLLLDHRRLLWAVERLVNLDLDKDGATGEPEERLVIVNAEASHRTAAQRANAERRSAFASFVARLPVKGTSQRAWEKELGRDKYQEYRDALIRLGWAAWLSLKDDGTPNERRGWDLTVDPADILRRISG